MHGTVINEKLPSFCFLQLSANYYKLELVLTRCHMNYFQTLNSVKGTESFFDNCHLREGHR